MSATRLQSVQYNAIEAVNAIVEVKGFSAADRKAAIELVRAHLDARAEQLTPVGDPDEDLL